MTYTETELVMINMVFDAFIALLVLAGIILVPGLLLLVYNKVDTYFFRKKIKRLMAAAPDCPHCNSRPKIYSEYCGRVFFGWEVSCPHCYPGVSSYDHNGEGELECTIGAWHNAVANKGSTLCELPPTLKG